MTPIRLSMRSYNLRMQQLRNLDEITAQKRELRRKIKRQENILRNSVEDIAGSFSVVSIVGKGILNAVTSLSALFTGARYGLRLINMFKPGHTGTPNKKRLWGLF